MILVHLGRIPNDTIGWLAEKRKKEKKKKGGGRESVGCWLLVVC